MTAVSGTPVIDRRVWSIATVVMLSAAMAILDATIVNVALDTLVVDLDSPLVHVQWVASGYLLAMASVVPISGWLANRFGARRVYIAALLVFTTGSTLCGFAWSLESLVAFRALQGLGGGLMLPIGQMLLVRAAAPGSLARVLSFIGVPMLVAPALGPALGGLVLEVSRWETIFWLNLPIGVAAIALAPRLLAPDSPGDHARLDVAGFMLATSGVVALSYGLAEAGNVGRFSSPSVIAALFVGAIGLAAFAARSLRVPLPLLELRLYADRAYSAASVTTFAVGASLFGSMIVIALYYTAVRSLSPLETGLLMAPQGLGAAIAMRLTGPAAERFGPGHVAFAGVVVTLLATIPMTQIDASTPYLALAVYTALRGFGLGLSIVPAMAAAFSSLRPELAGHASPQLTSLRGIGASFGVAVLTVVLQIQADGLGPGVDDPEVLAPTFAAAYWWLFAISAAAACSGALLVASERHQRTRSTDRVVAS